MDKGKKIASQSRKPLILLALLQVHVGIALYTALWNPLRGLKPTVARSIKKWSTHVCEPFFVDQGQ